MSILFTKDYQHFRVLSADADAEFVGADNTGRSLPGDSVVLNGDKTGCVFVKRAAHPLLPGILELTSKYMYGMTARGAPLYLFRPLNEAYPPFIVGSAEKDRTKNILVLVKFEFWEVSSKFPRGVIQEVLGEAGDIDAERAAIMWRYGPHRYNSKTPSEEEVKVDDLNREELRGEIFNIDPPGCRDVDDVLSIDFDRGELGVTIADVSEYIKKLDAEAFKRGATLYQGGYAVRPMLPANLSEDLCSLVPGERRLGLTLFINLDGGNRRWASTVLTNKKSYTYDDTFPSEIKECLSRLSASQDPHKWVEWAMLEYNKEAGKILKGLGQGILRRHAGPKDDLLNKWKGHIDDSILKVIAMQSAEYCLAAEENSDHQMIGTDAYAHASSPLRRYCDLVNQRILKGDCKTVEQEVVDWLNVRQKESKAHDRDLCFLEAIIKNNRPVEGVALDESRIYIKNWQRVIKTSHRLLPGQQAQIHWFVDWSQAQWKRRLVFSVSSVDAS